MRRLYVDEGKQMARHLPMLSNVRKGPSTVRRTTCSEAGPATQGSLTRGGPDSSASSQPVPHPGSTVAWALAHTLQNPDRLALFHIFVAHPIPSYHRFRLCSAGHGAQVLPSTSKAPKSGCWALFFCLRSARPCRHIPTSSMFLRPEDARRRSTVTANHHERLGCRSTLQREPQF